MLFYWQKRHFGQKRSVLRWSISAIIWTKLAQNMSVFEFQKMRFKELKALTGRGTGCSEKKSKVSRKDGWNLLQYYFNHIDV